MDTDGGEDETTTMNENENDEGQEGVGEMLPSRYQAPVFGRWLTIGVVLSFVLFTVLALLTDRGIIPWQLGEYAPVFFIASLSGLAWLLYLLISDGQHTQYYLWTLIMDTRRGASATRQLGELLSAEFATLEDTLDVVISDVNTLATMIRQIETSKATRNKKNDSLPSRGAKIVTSTSQQLDAVTVPATKTDTPPTAVAATASE